MRKRLTLLAAASALSIAASAEAQVDRTRLPVQPAPFDGSIQENILDSTPSPQILAPVRAPQGAPNLFLFMSDDVGFAMASTFGGPVPTPNMDALAANGQRYNRFHTTGICSPTRAALLTGRNHHNAGSGYLADVPSPYPGYTAHIPDTTATIADMLRLNGYNTAMFGKHHNVPGGEGSAAGPFDMWPTGLGFEYFYGIIGGDADQWHPNLYRGISPVAAPEGPPVLMEKRLADDAISWVHNQKAAAPDKPFFIYYSPGSTHAPHQAPPEYIARFRGQFDQGWDKVREETHERQIEMGIIPEGTILTPRPEGIPAWDSLSDKQRLFAARAMEVAAAMLAYQDDQLGRVIDELERMGELDNTLVAILQGDNGASAEGGPHGTVNEIAHIMGMQESEDWLAENIGRLGGPDTYPNYPVGWAWAMNTPLRWTKQYASMLGATRNGMILSWPGHMEDTGQVCGEFSHVVDLVPTLLEAASLPAPDAVYGVVQKPLDGQSLLPGLAACDADKPRTQYFEISGKAAIYENGWLASYDDARKPWEPVPPAGPKAAGTWSLYNLDTDFSQSTDVSAENPQKLASMKALWQDVAGANHVFPLDHRFGPARAGGGYHFGNHYEYWGTDVSVAANDAAPFFAGRDFTMDADLVLDSAEASGVVTALASKFGGWSLFLEDGKPVYVYAFSTEPSMTFRIASDTVLPEGASTLSLSFLSDGIGRGGDVTISSGDTVLAEGRVHRTFITPAGLGEKLDIGRDTGVLVTDYQTPGGRLEGDVPHVEFNFAGPPKMGGQ